METLFVRVETEDGAVGWGEGFGFAACATTKRAVDDLVAPLAVGQEVAEVGPFMAGVRRRLHNSGRDGPVMFAISALDIALWDLAGQAAGQPIWQLLGGGAPDRLPVYASLLRYGDAGNCARNAAAAVARGHREIKLHEVDVEMVAAARQAIGPDIPLTVDTNCAWPADEAVAMARRLAPLDLT
jgi:L-alanine-DL-glutamate epimerase-like enolase superfamily enzyme